MMNQWNDALALVMAWLAVAWMVLLVGGSLVIAVMDWVYKDKKDAQWWR